MSAQNFGISNTDLDVNPTAAKVAEVFLTAGHAFQKLGDLTLKLNQPISENTNETKWSEREVDRLKESLTRFAQDLDNISESVQSRIVQRIKTDIKRRTTLGGPADPMLRTPLTGSGYQPTSSASLNTNNNDNQNSTSTTAVGGRPSPAEVKREEYVEDTPPHLVPASSLQQSQSNRSMMQQAQHQPSTGMKRPAPMPYSGLMSKNYVGVGGVTYKKHALGTGAVPVSSGTTTFRPVRTLNATVNASPGGGRSVSLLRSGAGGYAQQQQLSSSSSAISPPSSSSAYGGPHRPPSASTSHHFSDHHHLLLGDGGNVFAPENDHNNDHHGCGDELSEDHRDASSPLSQQL